MFVVHASTPAVISQHALTTAFDITTASQSTTYDVSSHTTSPRGLRFNSDGTKLYLNSDESSNKKVYEFSLSTAYDISSLSSPSSTVISGQDGSPRGIAFNTDGSKMFLLGDSNDTVYEYSLSTAFDTTTISYTTRSLDFSSKEVTPRGLSFNSTGTKLFITGKNSDDILEYDLSTGFNLSTALFNGAFDMTGTVSSPNDVVFNNDGTKAFIGQTGSNKIFSFSLSSPFSLG
jgi:DNA-binding beta-propeller fold protein YncE